MWYLVLSHCSSIVFWKDTTLSFAHVLYWDSVPLIKFKVKFASQYRSRNQHTDLKKLASVVFFEVKIVHSVVWSSDTLTTRERNSGSITTRQRTQLTLPYTFRGQNWSILFSLSNIEFTWWPLIQTKLKGNRVNIAREIKRERFYRKSDFRASSGVCLLM